MTYYSSKDDIILIARACRRIDTIFDNHHHLVHNCHSLIWCDWFGSVWNVKINPESLPQVYWPGGSGFWSHPLDNSND